MFLFVAQTQYVQQGTSTCRLDSETSAVQKEMNPVMAQLIRSIVAKCYEKNRNTVFFLKTSFEIQA